MARDRKKAQAAAREEAPPANTDQTSAPDASAAPASAPDVFDEAIAARQQPPAEAPGTPEPAATGFAGQVKRPDPFGEMTIALSNNNDGPKARLYRSHRFQQLAIQLDEKPDEGIRQRLRDDGWTWRPAEGAWTKQLGEQPGQTHRKAQAFFVAIANDIRQANGLEPVSIPAQGR
jgi:hypothetical protein